MTLTTEFWCAAIRHRDRVRYYMVTHDPQTPKDAMPDTLYLEGKAGPWRGPLMAYLLQAAMA